MKHPERESSADAWGCVRKLASEVGRKAPAPSSPFPTKLERAVPRPRETPENPRRSETNVDRRAGR
jgi:hypothetical protein